MTKIASGINALHDAVLAALPGSMQEIAARVGVQGQPVWDAVHTLRKAGLIRRVGSAKLRTFELAPAPEPFVASESISPAIAAAEMEKRNGKQRKRAVILFYIKDWPSQEPNRRMVWSIDWVGKRSADREIKHLKTVFKDEVEWELASLTVNEARRMRTKGYDIREVLERRTQATKHS